jgi:hypothetical protein
MIACGAGRQQARGNFYQGGIRVRLRQLASAPVAVLAATIVADQEQYRTLASYPDGSPRVQEFRGPLVVRYTNTSTNESVVRDLSGYGWFHYGEDGGNHAFIASHIGVTVPMGNTGFPPGEWVITGQSEVSISSSGAINVQLLHATAENLCRKLS